MMPKNAVNVVWLGFETEL